MNASIEAARAGDSGRGFGVVASQIRVLAQNTSNHTKIITETINKNIEDINIAVKINHQTVESFNKN
jgi:methyl-accepting chemotaxis protein